ncbi:3-keto-5-aminohexanoate cleavage protein, partial [Mycobacterium tuberculosis]|uniref:3-keto-5-aminohexanoate cleavage protein n=1 Tax=Mycobacterium tuberculosis TaxID=1773 RepID=UPI000E3955BD
HLVALRPRMAPLPPCSLRFGAGAFRPPPPAVRRLAARLRALALPPALALSAPGPLAACLRLWAAALLAAPLPFRLVLGVRGGLAAPAAPLLPLVRRLPP